MWAVDASNLPSLLNRSHTTSEKVLEGHNSSPTSVTESFLASFSGSKVTSLIFGEVFHFGLSRGLVSVKNE